MRSDPVLSRAPFVLPRCNLKKPPPSREEHFGLFTKNIAAFNLFTVGPTQTSLCRFIVSGAIVTIAWIWRATL